MTRKQSDAELALIRLSDRSRSLLWEWRDAREGLERLDREPARNPAVAAEARRNRQRTIDRLEKALLATEREYSAAWATFQAEQLGRVSEILRTTLRELRFLFGSGFAFAAGAGNDAVLSRMKECRLLDPASGEPLLAGGVLLGQDLGRTWLDDPTCVELFQGLADNREQGAELQRVAEQIQAARAMRGEQ